MNLVHDAHDVPAPIPLQLADPLSFTISCLADFPNDFQETVLQNWMFGRKLKVFQRLHSNVHFS